MCADKERLKVRQGNRAAPRWLQTCWDSRTEQSVAANQERDVTSSGDHITESRAINMYPLYAMAGRM